MEEMTTGLCPKCGHTLQIPAELERFSCMYCGERLTKRQLLTQPEEASCSEEDCAVSFDHAVSRLGWCVQNFRGYQKKILRDAFFEAFETYETGCAPVIQELNSGVRPERQTELLDRAAEAMLDELSAGWEKKNDMEDEKVILAIFFVPMVRKLQLPVSEEFVSLLQKNGSAGIPNPRSIWATTSPFPAASARSSSDCASSRPPFVRNSASRMTARSLPHSAPSATAILPRSRTAKRLSASIITLPPAS